MPSPADNLKPAILVACLLVLAAAALYWPTLQYGLVNYDDTQYIADNPAVTGGLTPDNIRWAWTTFHAANWHPLTWMSLQLDATIFGNRHGGFHATNVLLHAATSVLLFVLLWRATGALWRSAIVAAFFVVHPTHVESVAWVTERKDVLSGALGAGALLAYVEYARRPGAGRMTLVAVLLALGLLAKPMLVTWPFVMLLMDVWPLRRVGAERLGAGEFERAGVRGLVLEKLPLFAVVLAACVVTFAAQHSAGATVDTARITLTDRLSTAVVGYVRYLGVTFWPVDLAVFYPREKWAWWQVAGSAALLAGISAGVWRERVRRPFLIVGWLWFLGTLVPVIGLVQVGVQSMADRYTYIPHMGLFAAIVWGVAGCEWVDKKRGAVTAVTLAGLIVLGVLAGKQVRVWRDSESLWRRTLAVTRDNFPAHRNLGYELARQGRPLEAIPHLVAAAELAPHMFDVQMAAGTFLLTANRPAEAIPLFARAAGLRPGAGDALMQWADALQKVGRLRESAEVLRRLVAAEPGDARAHNALGIVLAQSGQMREAAQCFARATELDPALRSARENLARANTMLGATTMPAR